MPTGNTLSTVNLTAAGGTMTQDVHVAGEDFLTVIAQIGPTATAAGDVSVTVTPFLADLESTDHGGGPTLAPAAMVLTQDTTAPGIAAALAAGVASVMVRVRVTGIDKVRITLKNNNATTALPGRLDFYFD